MLFMNFNISTETIDVNIPYDGNITLYSIFIAYKYIVFMIHNLT